MISDQILQKNLRVLARKQLELARQIERANSPADWHVFEARNGMPTLSIDHEGTSLAVHSRYNPEREAQKWAAGVAEDWEHLIVFGVGLGYDLEALKEKHPDGKVTLVENDLAHLYQALGTRDLTTIFTWLDKIIVEENPAEASRNISKLLIGKTDALKFAGLSAYERIYPQYWQTLQQRLRDKLLTYRTNFATNLTFKYQWMLNIRENLIPYLEAPDIGQLFGQFEGIPIIVVAAGPSLDKNIHLLPELKGKALILAAGSAIGPLLHHEILPDLVVSIDPADGNYKHFEAIKEENLPLAFPSTINHHIVKNYPGPSLSFGLDIYRSLNLYFEQVVEREKKLLMSGPTIALTTLDLAMKLGGNPIILLGQDLAYADGRSHAMGNVGMKLVKEEGLMEIAGVSETVFTTPVFRAMKIQIEKLINNFEPTIQVIDATEGGALIEDTQVATLADTIKKHCGSDYPIQEKINQVLAQRRILSRDEQAKLSEKIEEILQDVKLFYESLATIDELAIRMTNRQQRGLLKPSGYERTNKQMIKAYNRYLRTDLFEKCIRHIQLEELELATSIAQEKVVQSATFEEKVQNSIEAYQKFFRGSFPFIQILEQKIFQPMLKNFQTK